MRAKMTTALSLAALFALTALSPLALAFIGPPAPPPEPGWGEVKAFKDPADSPIGPMAARSDGSFAIVGHYESDSTAPFYNATLTWRDKDYWGNAWLMGGLSAIGTISVATTNTTDRAGVYGAAIYQAGDFKAIVSFVKGDGSGDFTAPEVIADSPLLNGMQLTATPQGNVMAVWWETGGSPKLWANHSAALGGWDGSQLVVNTTSIRNFAILPVGADDFLLVWAQPGSVGYDVMSLRYTGGVGWGAPQRIGNGEADLVDFYAAGSAQSGTAVVAIVGTGGVGYNVTAYRYGEASGFGPGQVLFASPSRNHTISEVAVAVDGSGSVHLAYGEGTYAQAATNLTYRSTDGQGVWLQPYVNRIDAYPLPLRISSSLDGHLAATWLMPATTSPHIMVQRYVPGSGWRPAEVVDVAFTPYHRADNMRVAAMNGGNVTVVWRNAESYGWSFAARDFIAGNDPPIITLTSPSPGAVLVEPTVLVAGTVSPAARVSVAGLAASVGSDGSFSARVALSPGTHNIEVFAIDEWGNSGSASVTVTFNDPVASELAAAQTELDQTAAELGTVKIQFAWLETNQSAAQANATLFKGELVGLQADYDAAQARVIWLEAQQNATTSVVQNTTSQNSALAGQVAVLSIVAFASLIAGVGALAVTLIQSKRGGGGGGGGGGGSGDLKAAPPATQGAEPAKGGPHDKGEPGGPANHGG